MVGVPFRHLELLLTEMQRRRPNLRLVAFAVLAVWTLSSCSASAGTVTDGTGTGGATLSRLPGESLSAFWQRNYYACMDERGEDTYVTLPAGDATGPSFLVRGYDETRPATKKDSDECSEQAKRLAPAPVLTRAQLESGYRQIAKQVQCLRDAGFDMGVTVSLEDFLAKAGDVEESSRYAAQNPGPAFSDAEWNCAKLYPLPPEG